jgi:hypothetical protein
MYLSVENGTPSFSGIPFGDASLQDAGKEQTLYFSATNKHQKSHSRYFYLPVLDGETWQITQYFAGQEKTLTKEQFERFVRGHFN